MAETKPTKAQDSAAKARDARFKIKDMVLKKIGANIDAAETMEELTALVRELKPEERNAITHEVRAATERIVNVKV